MKKIIIVGGGAAGMFAAVSAANEHTEVHIYEHNEKLGKKLFITGKGRCNITNGCDDVEELLSHVVTFPISDKSSDVIRTLERVLKDRHVQVHLKQQVCDLWIEDNEIRGIFLSGGEKVEADVVILAAGGVSYPSTGSTGDGYRMAEHAGHHVTPRVPSLVPMVVDDAWCTELQGLSLKNINFSLRCGKKEFYREFGEMMFTHFGITGPVVLSGSTRIAPYLKKGTVTAEIDMKPSLTEEQLDARLLRDFDKNMNKQIRNALSELLPSSLIPVIIRLSEIDPYMIVHDVTKQQRQKLIHTMRHLTMTVTGVRGFNEAIITQGGIRVKEVDPSTMASKLVKGLYFAGEILDLDAVTGGYNLQIAWSTAYLAGRSAAEAITE